MNKNNIDLSIIIIGYNEEKNIARTIHSIRNLDLSKLEVEIIYVDSNSEDETLNILKQYEYVKTYRIEANRYTAALGRFVGSKVANGKYILFLDADMEVESNTDINYCIDILEKNKDIGVVSGKLPEIWYRNETPIKELNDRYGIYSDIEELNDPGGYFIVNRKLLEMVGNFDIKLSCNEEIDLFSRIKKIKPRLVRTNKISCIHHFHMSDDSKKSFFRFKNRYFVWFWKVIFKSIKKGYLKEYTSFKTQIKTLRSTILTLIMIISLILSIKYNLIIAIPIVYYLLLIVIKKFNFRVIGYNQINNILRLLSIIFVLEKKQIDYTFEHIKTYE